LAASWVGEGLKGIDPRRLKVSPAPAEPTARVLCCYWLALIEKRPRPGIVLVPFACP